MVDGQAPRLLLGEQPTTFGKMGTQGFTDTDRICPQPRAWSKIYDALHDAWIVGGRVGEPPPTPVILSGWWHTPAVVKWIAWQETVQWAAERDLSHLIPELASTDWASVADASGANTPEYQYHNPAPKPSLTSY